MARNTNTLLKDLARKKRRTKNPKPIVAEYQRRKREGAASSAIRPIIPNPGAQARLFYDVLGFKKGQEHIIEYPRKTTEDALMVIDKYEITYPYPEVLEDSAKAYELLLPDKFEPKQTTINFHCGNGAGKTMSAGAFITMMTQINRKGKGLISANTFPQLEKATLVALLEFFLRFNVPFYPWQGTEAIRRVAGEGRELTDDEQEELTKSLAITAKRIAHYDKWMLINGCRHDVLSADAYQGGSNNRSQSGRGLQVSWAILDEYARTPDATAFQAIITRNRLKGTPPILLLTSTPNTEGLNWVYRMFDDPALTPEQMEGKVSIEGSSIENRHFNDENYVSNMFSNMDKEMFLAEVFGKYIEGIVSRLVKEEWIAAAVQIELHIEKPPLLGGAVNQYKKGGLDVANTIEDGKGDESVLAIVEGSTLTDMQTYKLDTYDLAKEVHRYAMENRVSSICYDGDGLGVGTGNDLAHKEDRRYTVVAAKGSRSASDEVMVTDFKGNDIKANDLFYNERAERGWLLRVRFKKTYEVLHGIADYPDNELISIPNNAELIRQIKAVTWSLKQSGGKQKIILTDKDKISSQLGRSPDHYDALTYALTHVDEGGVSEMGWISDVYG